MNEQMNLSDDFKDEDQVASDLNLWEYKHEGATIIGIVEEVNKEGTYGLEITLNIGEEKTVVLPTLKALETKMKDVVVGDKVKIVYKGMVKSANKKEYADFDVFVKKTS